MLVPLWSTDTPLSWEAGSHQCLTLLWHMLPYFCTVVVFSLGDLLPQRQTSIFIREGWISGEANWDKQEEKHGSPAAKNPWGAEGQCLKWELEAQLHGDNSAWKCNPHSALQDCYKVNRQLKLEPTCAEVKLTLMSSHPSKSCTEFSLSSPWKGKRQKLKIKSIQVNVFKISPTNRYTLWEDTNLCQPSWVSYQIKRMTPRLQQSTERP